MSRSLLEVSILGETGRRGSDAKEKARFEANTLPALVTFGKEKKTNVDEMREPMPIVVNAVHAFGGYFATGLEDIFDHARVAKKQSRKIIMARSDPLKDQFALEQSWCIKKLIIGRAQLFPRLLKTSPRGGDEIVASCTPMPKPKLIISAYSGNAPSKARCSECSISFSTAGFKGEPEEHRRKLGDLFEQHVREKHIHAEVTGAKVERVLIEPGA